MGLYCMVIGIMSLFVLCVVPVWLCHMACLVFLSHTFHPPHTAIRDSAIREDPVCSTR